MEPRKMDTTKKNRTHSAYVKTAQDLISIIYDKRLKVSITHQGKFESQWLNVVSYKNLGLKLDDLQLRISIGLRLGAQYLCCAYMQYMQLW